MRNRSAYYTILSEEVILVQGEVDIEDIRLIVNETQKVVICSSMKKDAIAYIEPFVDDASGEEIVFSRICINTGVCKLASDDKLTIEIDKGDTLDTTNIASKDLERFFGVKPIDGYEFMTPEEVCSTLEDIMTSMDLNLTPQQAQAITQTTLTQQ